MKILHNILAGLAGAIVLNVVHESARKNLKDAPHINEIGEEAIGKVIQATGNKPPKGNKLYATTLASDLVSNALYYSMIGKGGTGTLWSKGIAYGLTAGFGALGLTKPLGLDDRPVNRSIATKTMTVAWYVIGGLASAGVLKLLNKTKHA